MLTVGARLFRRAVSGRARCAIVLSVLASAACGGGEAGHTTTIVDSAGVSVVSNTSGAWTDETRWTIDTVPFLTVGEETDSANQMVSIANHLRMSNNHVVIVNNRRELRLYDSTGNFLGPIGRSGEGPGEYRTIIGLMSCNRDTIVVVDAARRVSYWTQAGEFVRGMAQPTFGTRRYAGIVGVAHDCSSLLAQDAIESPPDPAYTNRLNRYPIQGTEPESLLTYPGNEVVMAMYNGREWKQVPAWSAHPQMALSRFRVAIGLESTPEFRDYDLRGKLSRIVRWKSSAPIVVTDEDRARFDSLRAAFLKTDLDAPNLPPIAQMPAAKIKPVYSRILIDDVGNTWLCECADNNVLYNAIRDAADEGPWTVVDSTGVLLGTVKMPAGLLVQRISNDEVGAVWRDENDVPSIRMFRINKPR
jgi:hypothetical protein